MQADATKLGLVYESMAASFAEGGLNLPAVQASRCAPVASVPQACEPWHLAKQEMHGRVSPGAVQHKTALPSGVDGVLLVGGYSESRPVHRWNR